MVALPKPAPDPWPAPASDFPVGSRVRLQGLKSKPQLNGRDGNVVTFKEDTGRYAIELENYDGVLVNAKPENMALSPVPPESERAPLADDGCLTLAHSKAFSAILYNAMFTLNRVNSNFLCPDLQVLTDLSGPDAQKHIRKLQPRLYGQWTKGVLNVFEEMVAVIANDSRGSDRDPNDKGLHPLLKDAFTPTTQAFNDTSRWGDAPSRRLCSFWIVEDTPTGTLVVSGVTGAVYRVVGVAMPVRRSYIEFEKPVDASATPFVALTLLPYRGRIVFDGMFMSPDATKSNMGSATPRDWTLMLKARCREAERRGAVVECISHEGPLHPASVWPTILAEREAYERSIVVTDTLRKLAEEVVAIARRPDPVFDMWVLRRMGYTRSENPFNLMFCMETKLDGDGKMDGQMMCEPMKTRELDPTPEEILTYVLKVAKVVGYTPLNLAVDYDKTQAVVQKALDEAKEATCPADATRGVFCGYYPPAVAEEISHAESTGLGFGGSDRYR